MNEEYEKLEKVVGNEHKYQKITLFIGILIFLSTNYLPVSTSYLVKKPKVSYYNTTDHREYYAERLTYEICDEVDKTITDFELNKTYPYSWSNEFNFDCNRIKVAAVGGSLQFGILVGAIIQVFIVDIIGRRLTLIYSLGSFMTVSLILNFIPSNHDYFYFIYIVCFFMGISNCCSFVTAYLYICEMNKFSNRPIYSGFMCAACSLCGIMHPTLYKFFQNNLINNNISFILALIALVLVSFLINETPKFFYMKGDFTKFLLSFRNIAKFNNRSIRYERYIAMNVEKLETFFFFDDVTDIEPSFDRDSDATLVIKFKTLESEFHRRENGESIKSEIIREKIFDIYKNHDEELDDQENFEKRYFRAHNRKYKFTLFDLFNFKSQRLTIIKLSFIWFIICGIYETVSTLLINFKGSIEVNGIVYYGIELIFFAFSGYIITFKNVGRIKWMVVLQIVALINYLIYLLIPLPGYLANISIIALKVVNSGTYVVMFIYSYEVYPLELSSKGFTINLIFGKVGCLLSNFFIEMYDSEIFYAFAPLEFICLLLIMTLPETVVFKKFENLPPEILVQSGINIDN